ncbi:MAG: ABC transporter permease [Peptococcaceae bacterium]|nr:ABC transporter permease [Peptococcaceae bacterium]
MNLWESVRVALDGIMANKLRSFLTTLGIIIGIAAVITVVAIGQGGRAVIMGEFEKIGTNIYMVWVDWRADDPPTGREIQKEDAAIIKRLSPAVSYLAPVNTAIRPVKGSEDQKSARLIGTTADYIHIRNLEIIRGRFLTAQDDNGCRRVAVVDEELARELYGKTDPIGQKLMIRNTPLVVVGLLKSEKSMFSFGTSKPVYIPISTWQYVFHNYYISQLEGKAVSREEVPLAVEQTLKILERRHNTEGRYQSVTLEDEMESANKVTGILTLIISAVAGISLLVGGIGVMNIMLVSVTERVREIGIRMALGARRRDILMQFLVEAVMLCLLGGLVGIVLGVGGAYLVAKLAHWPPLVSWGTVAIAVLFSAVIGIFFGIYPANKAARMNPIEALRRE